MIALELINKGFKNTSVVDGGWNAMRNQKWILTSKGKIIYNK